MENGLVPSKKDPTKMVTQVTYGRAEDVPGEYTHSISSKAKAPIVFPRNPPPFTKWAGDLGRPHCRTLL